MMIDIYRRADASARRKQAGEQLSSEMRDGGCAVCVCMYVRNVIGIVRGCERECAQTQKQKEHRR